MYIGFYINANKATTVLIQTRFVCVRVILSNTLDTLVVRYWRSKAESRSNADLVYSTSSNLVLVRNSPHPASSSSPSQLSPQFVACRRRQVTGEHSRASVQANLKDFYYFMVCFGSRLILLTPPTFPDLGDEPFGGPVRLITDREKDDYGTGRPPKRGKKLYQKLCFFRDLSTRGLLIELYVWFFWAKQTIRPKAGHAAGFSGELVFVRI